MPSDFRDIPTVTLHPEEIGSKSKKPNHLLIFIVIFNSMTKGLEKALELKSGSGAVLTGFAPSIAYCLKLGE